MKEWIMIGLMTIGGMGFSIGGTGPKWVRRYLMPFLLAILMGLAGIVIWKCVAYGVIQSGVLHVGYGEKVGYIRKFIAFADYILPSLLFGLTPWQIITPLLMVLIFWLSNNKKTASSFEWKCCEFIYGTLIGITLSQLI